MALPVCRGAAIGDFGDVSKLVALEFTAEFRFSRSLPPGARESRAWCPLGPAPGVSRLVGVKFGGPVARGDSVVVALLWEAIGPGGGLFPTLDGNLTLAPAGPEAVSLRLEGVYRPPLGPVGVQLDRVVLHKVAAATVRGFLGRVGTAITHLVRVTGPVWGNGHRDRSSLPPDAEVS